LERVLHRIQEKRESQEVALTLDILKHGKRLHATVSFDTDTGLKQASAMVADFNPLMKDSPSTIFSLQRNLTAFDPLCNRFSLICERSGTPSIRLRFTIDWSDFTWLESAVVEGPRHSSLDAHSIRWVRARHEPVLWDLQLLGWRIRQVARFIAWYRQEEARWAFEDHLAEGRQPFSLEAADANAIEEVNLAYENVKEVDCLDITKEGSEAYDAAVKRYEERIDRVDTRITAHLRDQLGTAKNANEMFRIFSRFNALFVQPHIREAIREY
jgi:dynein heavy chain 1, cytosolic